MSVEATPCHTILLSIPCHVKVFITFALRSKLNAPETDRTGRAHWLVHIFQGSLEGSGKWCRGLQKVQARRPNSRVYEWCQWRWKNTNIDQTLTLLRRALIERSIFNTQTSAQTIALTTAPLQTSVWKSLSVYGAGRIPTYKHTRTDKEWYVSSFSSSSPRRLPSAEHQQCRSQGSM